MAKRGHKGYIYALYKGDNFICEGTKKEISNQTGLSIKTLDYFRTKHYIVNRRAKSGKNNRKILIRIDGEDKYEDLQ